MRPLQALPEAAEAYSSPSSSSVFGLGLGFHFRRGRPCTDSTSASISSFWAPGEVCLPVRRRSAPRLPSPTALLPVRRFPRGRCRPLDQTLPSGPSIDTVSSAISRKEITGFLSLSFSTVSGSPELIAPGRAGRPSSTNSKRLGNLFRRKSSTVNASHCGRSPGKTGGRRNGLYTAPGRGLQASVHRPRCAGRAAGRRSARSGSPPLAGCTQSGASFGQGQTVRTPVSCRRGWRHLDRAGQHRVVHRPTDRDRDCERALRSPRTRPKVSSHRVQTPQKPPPAANR